MCAGERRGKKGLSLDASIPTKGYSPCALVLTNFACVTPQRCLNDVNCKSFDAGVFQNSNPKVDYCFLSYENEADVTARGDFVCDASFQMDYFEKQSESPVDGRLQGQRLPPCAVIWRLRPHSRGYAT